MRFFIGLLILAFAGLWRGEIRASENFAVRGIPARMIGLLFLFTIPLACLAFWVVKSALEAKGQKPDFRIKPLLAVFATLLVCPLLGIMIGFWFRTPRYPPKRRDLRDEFSCPDCDAEYDPTAAASGASMRCIRCGRLLVTPSPSSPQS